MSERRSSFRVRSNQLRSVLALCVLAATPAATCGITVGALLLRVEAVEARHWIVVDAENRELGSVVDAGSVLVDRDGFKALHLRLPSDPNLPLVGTSGLYFVTQDCSGTPYLLASAQSTVLGSTFFEPSVGLVGEIDGATREFRTFYSEVNVPANGCQTLGAGSAPGISVDGAFVEGFEVVPPLQLVTFAEHRSSQAPQ